MALKVVLVNPIFPLECHQHPPFIPLGLAYLGAVLVENNFEVETLDAQALRLNNNQIRDKIAEIKPDIVGVTSTTLLYKSALEVMRISKEVCPECTTIMGGVHVTFWNQNVFQDSPYVDIVVRKEGEHTFVELAKKIQSHEPLNGVLGITYRNKNGVIHQNPDRQYIDNLDDLPYPAFDLFPLEKYRKYDHIEFPIQMSRGCAFNCNYCSTVRMHGRKFRVRKPKKVVDEIEFLIEKYGATFIGFVDDAFTLNLELTKDFLNEMKNRKVRAEWDCQSRVDAISRELLVDMKKCGCRSLWFGVESGCKKILEAMGKQASLDEARTAFALAREAGIFRVANIVIGFPGETIETIEETINFVHELDPDDIGYFIATPYPGTPLYELVMKNGWLRVTDWNKYDTAHPIFETPELKMEDLVAMKEKGYRKFYLRPKHIFRALLRHDELAYSELKTSLAWLLRSFGIKFDSRQTNN